MTMTNYEHVGDRTGTRSARGRVLLVEDDALLRGALEILLSERLDVVAVSSAEAALDGFVAGRYDVLVTDLGLPGRQGDELRRALCEVDPGVAVTIPRHRWQLERHDDGAASYHALLQGRQARSDSSLDWVSVRRVAATQGSRCLAPRGRTPVQTSRPCRE